MGELRWTIISANDGSRILDHDPKGWESLTLKFVRDEFYHGVFYEFSGGGSEVVPVGFYCNGGGKEFIDSLYDKYGQEADAYMQIEYRCQDGSFEEIYYGKLNFASYDEKFENQTLYSYLNIEQFGITQKVRNREEVPVNVCGQVSLDGLPLTNYDSCYNLNLHSKKIFMRSLWEKNSIDTFCGAYNTSSTTANWVTPAFTLDTGEISKSSELSLGGSLTPESLNDNTIIDTTGQTFYLLPDVFNVEWDISGVFTDESFETAALANCGEGTPTHYPRTTGGQPMRLSLYYGQTLEQANTVGQVVHLVTINAWAASGQIETQPFSGSGSTQITLQPGDKFWFVWTYLYNISVTSIGADIVRTWDYANSFLDITLDSVFPASTSKAALMHEAWSRLCETITDQEIAFKSEYYGRTNSQPVNYSGNGCNSFAAITSGKNIRGFDNEPINISLKNMFSNCNGIDNIGLGIENGNIIRVEKKKYFYDDTVIFEKPYVPGISINFSNEFVFNEIELGYNRWEITEVNGLDEPNSKRKFALPDVRSLKKNLTARSGFVAGSYPLEVTRRLDSVNYPTQDFGYDYDIFIIALNRSVNGNNQPSQLTTAEKDENFDSITNYYFPETGYNFRYSPTMNLLRWFSVYSIGMNKVLNYQNYWIIILTDYEGNVEMTTRLSLHAEPKCPGEFGYEQGGFFIPLTLVEKPQYQSPVGSGIVSGYPVPLAPFSVEQLYGEPLFMPEEITFEHPVSYSEFKTIKNNPKGLVRIAADGINYMSGYIKTFEFDLRRKMGSFVLYRKS